MLHHLAAFSHIVASMIGHVLSAAVHAMHPDAGKADLINYSP